MHTLLIDGLAIAVTDADRADAEVLFGSDGFKDDLKTLTADGKPLWDGTAAFVIRAANEEEAALFDESDFDDDDFEDDEAAEGAEINGDDFEDEDEDDEDDDGDAFEVMFLVPVDQFPDEA